MSFILSAILAAAPVQANDIVVTGKAKTPEEERKEIREYIRNTGIAKGETPAARWTIPVCPKVYGVPEAIADRVTAQVRAVAIAANIKTAKADCEPNIAITFVDNGAAFANTMRKKSHRHFSDVDLREKDVLFESDAPIRWWYATTQGAADGTPSQSGGTIAAGVTGGEGGQSVLAGVVGSTSGFSIKDSLISTGTARSIVTATVVIDVNKATGTSLNAVADYAAFVALAEIDPPKEAPPQSVLGLFAGASDGMTQRDRNFLTALYKIPLDRQAYQQRGNLTGKLLKAAAADPVK
jgi:hypothetical protein